MTISAENPDVHKVDTDAELYYDPYNIDLNMNPYAVFARLREEAP
ncbi:cytochrome P450, partial [Mycolicibacterium elephantis]